MSDLRKLGVQLVDDIFAHVTNCDRAFEEELTPKVAWKIAWALALLQKQAHDFLVELRKLDVP